MDTLKLLHELAESSETKASFTLDKLNVDWADQPSIFAMVYLISGLAVCTESNQGPAKKFILEGAKHIESTYHVCF